MVWGKPRRVVSDRLKTRKDCRTNCIGVNERKEKQTMKFLKLSALALSALACATAHAQDIPAGCVANVISLATISGSPSYVRLRYEIEALGSAQQGVASMLQGLKEFKTATTPTTALSALITGTNDANNALHCSASIMGKYKPTDDHDRVMQELMVQAFNQEATAILWLQDDTKETILRAVGQDHTTPDIGKNAEARSAMEAKQNEAAESLMMAVTESLMLSVDLSNMKAKNTVKTMLSCGEFKDLRKQSAAVMSGGTSTY
jgi:hypothetical protein